MHLDFKEVAGLINASGVTEIVIDKPIKSQKNKWSFYKGHNRLPHFTYNFFVLYFHAEATKESIDKAFYSLKKYTKSKIQVVFAPSMRQHVYLEEVFKECAGIRNTNAYLASFIQEQTRAYLNKLKELEPAYFIQPSYDTPSGIRAKIPNPLMLLLDKDGVDIFRGALGILVAEAGQGKTYTTQFLASALCEADQIPIYINSRQWVKLTADDLSSLWKTIAHSFKFYNTPISWMEGNEKEFIRVTLKGSIFRLIFDGFDEYILWNHGKVNPHETLKLLLDLAQTHGAKILITSRTSFWDSDISKSEFDTHQWQSLLRYEIIPFDENSARNYFAGRFPDSSDKEERAVNIFRRLKSADTTDARGSFIGRGFIIALIADLVDRTKINPPSVRSNVTIMKWLMEALCIREQERQQLAINSEEQLTIFREFAEHIASGGSADSTQLQLTIGVCVTSLEKEQISQLVSFGEINERGSLQDHPLIKKKHPEDKWEFVHDQIFFNLIAEQIINYVESESRLLQNLISNINITGSLASDFANAIFDQIYSLYASKKAEQKIKMIIKSILDCCKGGPQELDNLNEKLQLLTAIALLTVNTLLPKGSGRKERTKQLLALFPKSTLSSLCFSRTIASFDFSGVVFNNCIFDEVTWANCKFDEYTKFDNCRFIGGRTLNCENFGLSEWTKDLFDEKAKSMIYASRIRSGRRKYSLEDLRSDIGNIIKKFIAKEGIGFKTVSKNHLTTGVIEESTHKDQIIKSFKKYVIEKHELSRVSDNAYHLREEAKDSVQTYSNNGVFTGALARVFEEVSEKIKE